MPKNPDMLVRGERKGNHKIFLHAFFFFHLFDFGQNKWVDPNPI